MNALLEFLRVLRYGQALLSVRYHEADLERTKIGLAKAFAARDKALADLNCFSVERDSEPPAFLVRVRQYAVTHASTMFPTAETKRPTLASVKPRRAPRVYGETS